MCGISTNQERRISRRRGQLCQMLWETKQDDDPKVSIRVGDMQITGDALICIISLLCSKSLQWPPTCRVKLDLTRWC